MNISKAEQRVLHVLAQGGMIRHRRDDDGHIVEALCFTRDGFVLAGPACPCFSGCDAAASSARAAARPTASRRRGFAPCGRSSTIAEE